MILTHGPDPSQVALTFDDGPNFTHSVSILRLLKEHNAKATFFVLGKWVKEVPFMAQDIVEAGHEIGNHAMNHIALGNLPHGQAEYEIATAQQIIMEKTGVSPVLFRPPYGIAAEECEQIVSSIGMKVVMWSQLSGDWAAESADEIISKINLDTGRGEIVLLHDGGPMALGADRSYTVEAVERLLQAHPEKKFVTVSELTL